jgi:hypothetical protein
MSNRVFVSRRLLRLGLGSAGAPLLARAVGVPALAQDFWPANGKLGVVGGRDEKALFPGLPGGGQTEIRMVQSIYTCDQDELEVAYRLKPYDMESWVNEWLRGAERNEELAESYASAGLKVTAHKHYRTAQITTRRSRTGCAGSRRPRPRRRTARHFGDIAGWRAETARLHDAGSEHARCDGHRLRVRRPHHGSAGGMPAVAGRRELEAGHDGRAGPPHHAAKAGGRATTGPPRCRTG